MFEYNQKYVVFDTEAEGLNLFYSRPWQLAWNFYEGTKLISSHNKIIDWPDLKISDTVAKLTGFSWKTYNKEKINPKEALQEFKPFLFNKENMIVGQNLIGYDIFIIAMLQRLCGEAPNYSYINNILDTRPLFKAYKSQIQTPRSKQELLSWQYKILHDREDKTKCSQLVMLQHFGIPFEKDKLHDAVYDNNMCFENFKQIKRRLFA